MSERLLTARFDRREQADEAAAKLRAIRVRDVEVSPWNRSGVEPEDEQGSGDGFAMPGAGLAATGVLAFPPPFGGIGMTSAIGYAGLFPFDDGEDYPPTEAQSQGYLLCAVPDDAVRDMALRIIREAGGSEYE